MDGISINKFVSNAGFCSRREADKLIEQGRVTINDMPTHVGARVFANDEVAVDCEIINPKKNNALYIAFNKPVGVTSTTDIKDPTNIINFINHSKRIFPIGRLDKDSEGLILLTNDGDIVNKILRAGNEHEKEYIVTVDKTINTDFINKMAGGVSIAGGFTKKCKVIQEGNKRFRIILTQGLNRQIRKMCKELDYEVLSLKRIRIMNILITNIPIGKWRYLTPDEIKIIEKQLIYSSNAQEKSVIRPRKIATETDEEIALKRKTENKKGNTTKSNFGKNKPEKSSTKTPEKKVLTSSILRNASKKAAKIKEEKMEKNNTNAKPKTAKSGFEKPKTYTKKR